MNEIIRVYQSKQILYEWAVAEIIKTWPGDGVCIDGGAHEGLHTESMLRRDDAPNVYAIEAIPALCNRLALRFSRETRFRLIRCAIGKAHGEAEFSIAVDAPGYSGLRERSIQSVNRWEKLRTTVITLDEAISPVERSKVTLIKLDLEGGEFDALLGANDIIASSHPLLVFENGLRTSAAHYGYGWREFANFFESHCYQVFDFFGNRVDQRYWEATLMTYMFVALPNDKVDGDWLRTDFPKLINQIAVDRA